MLVLFGLILIAAGLLLSFMPGIPFLGRLPGDIQVERKSFSFYFPITTCLLLSILLTLLFSMFRR